MTLKSGRTPTLEGSSSPLARSPVGAGLPFVSIVMPVRNEASHMAQNLTAVLAQDYPPDRFEVIVADGRSTDGTSDIVQALANGHSSLRLVDNPSGIVATGLNRALAEARGDVIVRLDGHCEYPNDYVRRVVALRESTDAANAGGVLVPVGSSYVQRSICAAYSSRWGIGGSALRAQEDSTEVREVDAVHGGCWRRDTLSQVGPFAEEMVRNQDDEMSFRLRKAGGRIVQATSIRVNYVVRKRWSQLFLQFAQYGYWKVRLVQKYPRQASARHLMPAALLFLFIAAAASTPFSRWGGPALALLTAAYGTGLALAALPAALRFSMSLWPGIVMALLVMQVGYGSGFWLGLCALTGGRSRMDRWFSRLTR
ncbi:MAG: glycosyltransferase family 2 protein [Acidobacteriota bacterium]